MYPVHLSRQKLASSVFIRVLCAVWSKGTRTMSHIQSFCNWCTAVWEHWQCSQLMQSNTHHRCFRQSGQLLCWNYSWIMHSFRWSFTFTKIPLLLNVYFEVKRDVSFLDKMTYPSVHKTKGATGRWQAAARTEWQRGAGGHSFKACCRGIYDGTGMCQLSEKGKLTC